MPYIKQEARERQEAPAAEIRTPGNLNYRITRLIIQFITENGVDYQGINDVMGALEGAKLEFYRRVAIPYENEKRDQNGDVY